METRRLLVYYKNIQAVSLKYSVRFKEGPETPTAFLWAPLKIGDKKEIKENASLQFRAETTSPLQ